MKSRTAPAPSVNRRSEKSLATRKILIEATIEAIATGGLQQTTLTRVSEASGLSRSLVGFHFHSKDEMLAQTLQYLLEEHQGGWQKALRRADLTPVQRIRAVIDFDFGPVVCNPKRVAVWYAFWGAVRTRPLYRKLCAPADRAYADAVAAQIREIIGDGGYKSIDPDAVAQGYSALIIGLWEQYNIEPERFDRERAKDICLTFLSGLFPKHFQPRSR